MEERQRRIALDCARYRQQAAIIYGNSLEEKNEAGQNGSDIEEESDKEEEESSQDGGDELQSSTSNSKSYSRASYLPTKDSCLRRIMDEHKCMLKGSFRDNSCLWGIGTNRVKDPVASRATKPDDWYQSRFKGFTWLPLDSFGTIVDIHKIWIADTL